MKKKKFLNANSSGKVCSFKHLEICKRFVKHGGEGRLGCEGCEKFHPKLCRNSKDTKKCLIQNCKFRHLKGTQRKPEIKNTKTNDHSIKSDKNKKTANDFLEMKQEIKELKKLLQRNQHHSSAGSARHMKIPQHI